MAVAPDALRHEATAELQELLHVEASAFPGLNRVLSALQTAGKLMSPNEDTFAWGLLPILVVEAAGGDPRAGLPLAAAADCLIAASDVLDDVEDEDSPTGLERTYGQPTAINVGVFLSFLAQLALHRLARLGLDEQTVRAVCRVFASAGARACCGQQRDIDQDDGLLTEDGYLQMVEAKSGALVEGLCRAAALVAAACPETTEAYAHFGRNLGIALQVSNDVRAVSAQSDHRNDLVVGKRTLPLVFALQQAPAAAQRLASVARAGQLGPAQVERLGELLNTSGGLLYASVVADAFFEDALASLDEADCPQSAQLRAYVTALRRD